MKRILSVFALAWFGQSLSFVHAGPLQLGNVSSYLGNTCWYQPSAPSTVTGNFTLPGVSGTGSVVSSAFFAIQPYTSGTIYTYTLDLSLMSAVPGHCVKLSVYFGNPESGCNGTQVFVLTNANDVPVFSASENLSSVLLSYGGAAPACLLPGQHANSFAMISPTGAKTNRVSIIDDYVDAFTGLTNHYVTYAQAIVPDLPPIYVIPLPPWFQGLLKLNSTNSGLNGPYDFALQCFNAPSNGSPVSESITSTVDVVNGLLNVPLNFDPGTFFGQQLWLGISVRPAGSPAFTPLSRLAVSPTPQAVYAYTAGSVADLSPGQAVTSLNGLTDTVNLQAGSGIVLGTNGNALTISAVAGAGSDRNIKTDFAAINPAEVLARVTALPVQSWRYTNELARVRHIGPMAQDFMQAFRLGNDDKIIGYVDENGVALAAIQGLNQKVDELKKELSRRDTENAELKQRLEALEKIILEGKQP